jgi:hypothetical protein
MELMTDRTQDEGEAMSDVTDRQWRPMSELPDGDGDTHPGVGRVWIAHHEGRVADYGSTMRHFDAQYGRIAWMPYHPGVPRPPHPVPRPPHPGPDPFREPSCDVDPDAPTDLILSHLVADLGDLRDRVKRLEQAADAPTEHCTLWPPASAADAPTEDAVDTSAWPEYVMVRSDHLRVRKVEHEVVEWEASFCSEDAIPTEDTEPWCSCGVRKGQKANGSLSCMAGEGHGDDLPTIWKKRPTEDTEPDSGPWRVDHGTLGPCVVSADGSLAARCNTEAMANLVAAALNAQPPIPAEVRAVVDAAKAWRKVNYRTPGDEYDRRESVLAAAVDDLIAKKTDRG